MKKKDILKNGIIDQNPVLVQVIGMCPTLAITTSAMNGIYMGIATTLVLMFSNMAVSLVRKFIPNDVRIPSYIVIIASLTTVVELLVKAYLPAIDSALGLYIPLITVNCIVFARAEGFASKNTVIDSMFDGIGMGLGFTLGLTILSSIREIIGNGSIFGYSLSFMPKTILMILPPGGFMVLACVIAAKNYITREAK